MTIDIISIVVLLIIAVLVPAIFSWRESRRYGTTTGTELVGICKSSLETITEKEERKQKVLGLFSDKPELSNADIREILGVSGRTVVRYMDELEQEGKVKQIGEVGYAVRYSLK